MVNKFIFEFLLSACNPDLKCKKMNSDFVRLLCLKAGAK